MLHSVEIIIIDLLAADSDKKGYVTVKQRLGKKLLPQFVRKYLCTKAVAIRMSRKRQFSETLYRMIWQTW